MFLDQRGWQVRPMMTEACWPRGNGQVMLEVSAVDVGSSVAEKLAPASADTENCCILTFG